MAGSITRRGDAWRVVVSAGLDPSTGKYRQVVRHVTGSRRDAEVVCAEMVTEIRSGVIRHGSDATLAQLLAKWLDQANLSPSTALDYRRAIASHLPARFTAQPVSKIRTHQLDDLYTALTRNGLGPARIRRVHNILRRALGQAVKWQWIGRNPAIDASPPPVRRKKIDPPAPAAVRQLIDACDGQLRLWVVLGATLGTRRGELSALQWSDIDLDEGTVSISRALVEGGPGVGIVTKGTKTDQARTVAIDPSVTAMLRAARRERLEVALAAGVTPGPWVFATDPAGADRPRPDSLGRRFAKLRDRAGLTGVRGHDLRHFVATQLLANGVDPRTVAGRLGHSRTSTTLDTYAAFVPVRDRDAADLLGRLLG